MSEAAAILDSTPTQETKTETVATEPAVPQATDGQPSKDTDKVSSKIEILIRREAQARAYEQRLKEEQAKFEQRLKEFEEKQNKYNEFESIKKDPKKALSALGLTYDEITQAHLNDGELPPSVQIQKLREEIEQYKLQQKEAETLKEEKAAQEAKAKAQAQEQEVVENFKKEIATYVEDNSSRYEFIKFENELDLVYDVVDEYYTRTLAAAQKQFELGEITEDKVVGRVMSIKEAADKVEAHLEAKYNKAKELSKTKALWGTIPKETQKQVVQEAKKTQPPKTLTNQLSATAPVQKPKFRTDQERIQDAIAFARGLRPQ